MDTILKIIFVFLIGNSCFAQGNKDSSNNARSWCGIPKDDPIHFDPYYNGHLWENFNPNQLDFSKEYFNLQTKHFENQKNLVRQFININCETVWLSNDIEQNGIIGLNYQRIRFFISSVKRDTLNPLIYHLNGKSNVSGNICDFRGTIKLTHVFFLDTLANSKLYELYYSYNFEEDQQQKHSGKFVGIGECSVKVTNKSKKAILQDVNGGDMVYNRTYVGVWIEYKSTISKKCIWGDDRLPFVFDFECGDGEMRACEEYEKNGWVSFNNRTEFKEVNGKRTLINKWWLSNRN